MFYYFLAIVNLSINSFCMDLCNSFGEMQKCAVLESDAIESLVRLKSCSMPTISCSVMLKENIHSLWHKDTLKSRREASFFDFAYSQKCFYGKRQNWRTKSVKKLYGFSVFIFQEQILVSRLIQSSYEAIVSCLKSISKYFRLFLHLSPQVCCCFGWAAYYLEFWKSKLSKMIMEALCRPLDTLLVLPHSIYRRKSCFSKPNLFRIRGKKTQVFAYT